MSSPEIVSCRIHPGIGIARIGNSPNEFFLAPETPDQQPAPANGLFKDAAGAIKRQVQRFRIYGLDSQGRVVAELTADNAAITWTAHLANKKAAWYNFITAMDIPEAKPVTRRNAGYPGDRNNLVIDPGPRSVTGRDASAKFDTGTFFGIKVPLGELRTDERGRLLVFGGLGKSDSATSQPISNFNYDWWYDDISDGPVSARVTIGSRTFEADPAWVIVGPPSYAPGIKSFVTMYQVVYEAAVAQWLTPPAQVSFTQHILPVLECIGQLQWVNHGFYLDYGWGAPDDFLDPKNLAQLSSNAPEQVPLRQRIFHKFRDPDGNDIRIDALPPMYGDAITNPPDLSNPRSWLSLPPLQYDWLRQWAAGNFKADWQPSALSPPPPLEDLPLDEQPAALDKAALDHCLGGAFHPGHETTWIMRHALLYRAPFRIKQRPADQPEKDYGVKLTPAEAVADDGPLNGSAPGDLTRWMAAPWQVDTAGCGAGYQPQVNPFFPTFWPARVPNQILTEKNYLRAMNNELGTVQQQKYFSLRQDWLRDFTILLSFEQRVEQFLLDWAKVGIVTQRAILSDNQLLPPFAHVEMQNELEEKPDDRFDNINPHRHR